MKRHKYSIVFREDVIDELEKRTGKPRELLDELIQLHYDRIDDIMTNHETPYIISIPYIGKLRMNYMLTMSYRKNYFDKSVDKHIEFFRGLINKGEKTLINFRKPIILNQYVYITGDKLRTVCKTFYTYVRAIEEIHNKWYVEKFKNS
jgi:hypothetical protein